MLNFKPSRLETVAPHVRSAATPAIRCPGRPDQGGSWVFGHDEPGDKPIEPRHHAGTGVFIEKGIGDRLHPGKRHHYHGGDSGESGMNIWQTREFPDQNRIFLRNFALKFTARGDKRYTVILTYDAGRSTFIFSHHWAYSYEGPPSHGVFVWIRNRTGPRSLFPRAF